MSVGIMQAIPIAASLSVGSYIVRQGIENCRLHETTKIATYALATISVLSVGLFLFHLFPYVVA